MKNMKFEEFKEIISRKNHDIEFIWKNKTYWLNILSNEICINIVKDEKVNFFYFKPLSSDFLAMIEEFIVAKIFDGKNLLEIESEIEVVSNT